MFIGRENELARFSQEMDRVRCAIVYGVGGIGKTAFSLRACEALAERKSARLAHHTCRPGDGPTSIFASALEQLAAASAHAPPAAKPIEALLEWTRDNPTVLCIDDLHRTDAAPVLEAVAHVANRARSLWLCLTSRELLPLSPVTLDHLVLRLAGLGPAAVDELWASLESLYGGTRVQRTRATYGGTPLLIKHAFSSPDAPELSDAFGLAALGDAEARVLSQLAAFRVPVPESALLDGSSDARAALVRLERRFLVEPADVRGDRVALHDVVRDAVLRSLHAPTASTHEHCLRHWQTSLGVDPGSDLVQTEIVFHATEARRDELLLEMLERESREVRRVPPASTVYDREISSALDRLEQRQALPTELVLLRARIRARQGEIASGFAQVERLDASGPMFDLVRGELGYMLGRFAEAETRLKRVADDRELSPPLRAFGFALTLDIERQLGRGGNALAALALANDVFEPLGAIGAGMRAWLRAVIWMDSERYDRAVSELDIARRELGAAARMVSDFALLESMARSAEAYLGNRPSSEDEPAELFDENAFFRIVARVLHAQERFVRGDALGALEQAERAIAAATELGAPQLALWARWVWADAAYALGRYAEIAMSLEEALATEASLEQVRAIIRLKSTYARSLEKLGRAAEAKRIALDLLPALDDAPGTRARMCALLDQPIDAEAERQPVGYDAVEHEIAVIEAALGRGELRGAEQSARRALERCTRQGFRWLAARALAVSAEASLRTARFEEAESATAELEGAAARGGYTSELVAAETLRHALRRSRGHDAEVVKTGPLAERLQLTAPLSLELVTASGVRRVHTTQVSQIDFAGYALAIDFSRGTCWIGGQELSLARRAALLATLRALSNKPGELVPTVELGTSVLGAGYHPLRHHSRLAMNVARLRQLIGPELVQSTREGYRLVLPEPWLLVSAARSPSDSRA